MNNIFGLVNESHRPKDLKIITSIPIPEVKDPEYVKEKIKNKMALETSETSDTNARPSFKFVKPQAYHTWQKRGSETPCNHCGKILANSKCNHCNKIWCWHCWNKHEHFIKYPETSTHKDYA